MPSEPADFQRQAGAANGRQGRRVLLDLRDRLNNFLDLSAADLTAADLASLRRTASDNAG
jgi:hypothetical protein